MTFAKFQKYLNLFYLLVIQIYSVVIVTYINLSG